MKLKGFLMTREMAYLRARDIANMAIDPHGLHPWTDQTHDLYVAAMRAIWTLDDEFTQQDFERQHGRAPFPLSDEDATECLAIWERRKTEGLIYGPMPEA